MKINSKMRILEKANELINSTACDSSDTGELTKRWEDKPNSPIKLLNSNNNFLLKNSVFNSTDPPFNLEISNFITSMNILAANRGCGNDAITTIGVSNSPKYINSIASHAGSESYTESNTSAQSKFNGIFKVFPASCGLTGNTNPAYINTTCDKTGGSDINPQTVRGGFTLANSFVGQVTNDSKNSSNTGGSQAFGTISDWLNFENKFRGWGKQGTFPTSSVTGRCSFGTCQIWDWSLKSTDSVVRNVNACPSGSTFDTHQWSDTTAPNQAYCDANYKGSVISGTICINLSFAMQSKFSGTVLEMKTESANQTKNACLPQT